MVAAVSQMSDRWESSRMSSYKYTVIIPHYNDINRLGVLIGTIPSRKDVQVIVVDDNTFADRAVMEAEVRQYGRAEVSLYFNREGKRGAGGCRNIGIEQAQGEWLVFADADDFFTEGAFEAFDQGSVLEADIVYFKMTSVTLPDNKPGTRHIQFENLVNRYLKHRNHCNEINLRYNFPSPCAKMVRRSMVVEYGITFEDLRWANDVMFATKCGFYARSIDVVDATVYCATRKSGTLTTIKSETAFKTRLDVFIRKTAFLRDNLSRSDFRKVTRWPGNKLLMARLDGYDRGILQYTRRELARNKISLRWVNLSDVDEAMLKIRSYIEERAYKKRSGENFTH